LTTPTAKTVDHAHPLPILNAIKSIALEIENNIDISMQPTPEVKINSSQNNNPDSFNKTEVKIKLPKR
jgi:hypothetical protein